MASTLSIIFLVSNSPFTSSAASSPISSSAPSIFLSSPFLPFTVTQPSKSALSAAGSITAWLPSSDSVSSFATVPSNTVLPETSLLNVSFFINCAMASVISLSLSERIGAKNSVNSGRLSIKTLSSPLVM